MKVLSVEYGISHSFRENVTTEHGVRGVVELDDGERAEVVVEARDETYEELKARIIAEVSK